jgi:competence protein ComEC
MVRERDPLRSSARRLRGESVARAVCRHPFVSLTVPFAGGIAASSSWGQTEAAVTVALACATVAAALVAVRRFIAATTVLLAAFVAAGVARHSVELRACAAGAALVRGGAQVVVHATARVRSVPLANHPEDPAPRPQPFVMDMTAVRSDDRWVPAGGGMSVTFSPPVADLLPGDEIEVLATVRRPAPARYPGGYDLRRALATSGVYLVAYAPGASVKTRRTGSRFGPRRIAAIVRRRLAATLRARLPYREAEVCVAILLGHRPGVDPGDRARFTSSGLGHLLAVSGLHVAIIVGIAAWVLRRFGIPQRPVAACVAVLAVLYALVAGARAPVVRSAVMVVTYLAARAFERDRDGPNAVAFAAFAILLVQPLTLFDAGFQLSFAAVTFLAFLFPIFEEVWGTLRGAPERWMDPAEQNTRTRMTVRARQAVFASTAAWIGVQPLLVHYLGVLNPWGILSNVVMLPLVTISLAVSFASAVAGAALGSLGLTLMPLARVSLSGLLLGVEALSRLPMSVVWAVSPGPAWLVAYYATSFVLFAYARASRVAGRSLTHAAATLWARRVLVFVAGAFAVSVAAWWFIAAAGVTRPPSPSLTVFDYGSDRAAVIREAGGGCILLNA